MPRSQDEILVVKKGKLVISVTDEERRQFLQWVRDFSGSRKLGPPGVRANYYYLRDKPWSFVVPDYKTENPDGTPKKVLWSEWVSNNLVAARKKWISGDRGPDALDPDLLDDAGNADIQEWTTHDTIEDWRLALAKLWLDPWGGQPKRVLLVSEKRGVRGIIKSACQPTRTPFMCCGGDATMKQKANVGLWALWIKHCGLEPVLLYAGDHDAQGVNMDRTWVRDVAEIDSVTRVAITLGQARERDLPMEDAFDKLHGGANVSSARTGANTKIWEYIDEHGSDMVELDALVAHDELDLRNILRAAIDERIDKSIWDERQKVIGRPTDRAAELIDEVGETLSEEFPELWS